MLSADRDAAALVELAHQYGFVIVEDDAYHALWYDAPPPAPDRRSSTTTAWCRSGRARRCSRRACASVGCARRRGFVYALVRAKQACDLHTSTLAQALVADVLADESFVNAHLAGGSVRRTRRRPMPWRRRSTAGVTVHRRAAGMFLWRRVPGVEADALLERAIADRVAFVPGGAFAVEQRWNEHLRLSFATLPVHELEGAAATLRQLVAPTLTRRPA